MATVEYMKEYREANREELNRKRREYYAKNGEKLREARKGYYREHTKEYLARQKEWLRLHPEHRRTYQSTYNKEAYRKAQLEVLNHYSNNTMVCKLCGFEDIRALSLDHINGGGEKARREAGVSGTAWYRWLIKNDFPDGIQVLCMNCQFIKRHTNNEFPKMREVK